MLSDAKCRLAKPNAKPYKLADSDGLHLFVATTGKKYWRYRRQVDGKEKLVSLGRYPVVSLAQARQARDDLRDGTTPVAALPTVSDVIVDWLAQQAPRWKAHHAEDVRQSLAVEIEPTLGALRIDQVTAPLVLAVLKTVQARGAVELAHRLRQRLSSMLGYAVAAGIVTANPLTQLSAALQPVIRSGRRPALIELDEARVMLARAEAIPALPITRLALRLAVLTALRPRELRAATWAEVVDLDGDAPTWIVPALRMKHKEAQAASMVDHLVPLSRQAVDALHVLRGLTGGGMMFPSATGRGCLSENAIGYLLNRAGYASRQTAHGLRATFSTVMNEHYPGDRAVIDLMLAHVPPGQSEARYNRATHLARRRELAQLWADLIMDGRPEGAALMDLPRRTGVAIEPTTR